MAEGLVSISAHVGAGDDDPYAAGLPTTVNDGVLAYAARFCEPHCEKAAGFLCEAGGASVGGVLVEIGPSSLVAAMPQPVGIISACWVARDHRGSGHSGRLVAQAEAWCRSRGVARIELAYLASNALAATVWDRHGFSPFRVFASKALD